MHPMVAAQPSAWDLGWDALVAIGTLALAAATGWLALRTSSLAEKTAEEVTHSGQLVEASQRQVEATQAQAQAAQDALAAARDQTRISQLTLSAQIRPVLIDVPLNLAIEEQLFYPGRDGEPVVGIHGGVHLHGADTEVLVSLPLRNAGAGLALITGTAIKIGTELGPPPVMVIPSIIAAGEYGRVNFRTKPGDAAHAPLRDFLREHQQLSIEVGYTDLAGQQLTVSRFDVHFRSRAHTNWEVRQVHFQAPGTDAPYAGSAPVS
jgi:hypothetical protein